MYSKQKAPLFDPEIRGNDVSTKEIRNYVVIQL